ncbi:MAG: arginine--tRNA ligase, partial [Gammaproteobacteria bacterium]
MKQRLAQLIHDSLHALRNEGYLQLDDLPEVKVERCRDERHGDYASNIAMILAKNAKRPPKELAEMISKGLAENSIVKSVHIAGPGFINFYLNDEAAGNVIIEILEQQDHFGKNIGSSGQSILIEFVSANPTGPLHVGHGRGAAYGSCIANLLENAGHKVHREYYVNDAGRQMDILATSVWLRYLQQSGHALELPANVYQGDYIVDIACQLKSQFDIEFDTSHPPIALLEAYEGQDPETALDSLIQSCKETLGEQNYRIIHQYALQSIQENIRKDLENFRVEFDSWYSEEKLHASGQIEESVEMLKARDLIYQKDGAWWFRSTLFGDEKDRVAVRDNGSMTYFAADIAYHKEKFERGFDKVINIFGADHHGYIPRLRAILSALDIAQDRLEVLLVQFANLWRNGEKVQMSTRSGQFVTL